MRKSIFIPSSRNAIGNLNSKFYIQNPKSNAINELDKLEPGYWSPPAGEAALVQMWFKEMGKSV